ncbi:MAG: hypothetical protein R3214_03770 [Christiangramia sp.]|nr:hypothetical protein [Christiangramia sp.]
MKRLLGVLLLTLVFFSCQNEERKELMEQPEAEKVPDSIQVLTGEIVYGTNAAVIRGEDFVYGVTMDSLSKILAGKVAPLKSDDFDMIPVTVKAKILPNPEQGGWDEVIEIREIIEVSNAENVSDTIEE